MIAKKDRLAKKKDWQRIKLEGKSWNCRLWKAVYLLESSNKFACLVTKKNWAKAVCRNKVRRKIQEAVYDSFKKPSESLKTGWWLIIPRPGVEKVKIEELKKEWRETQTKIYG